MKICPRSNRAYTHGTIEHTLKEHLSIHLYAKNKNLKTTFSKDLQCNSVYSDLAGAASGEPGLCNDNYYGLMREIGKSMD